MSVAEALAEALREPGDGGPVTAEDIAEARHSIEAAATAAALHAGWTPDAPLRLAKASVGWLVRCPRRAVTPDVHTANEQLALGALIDAVAKVATVRALDPADGAGAVEAGLGWLAEDGSSDDLLELLAAPGASHEELMAHARDRASQLLRGWPPVDPAWWPRVDEWLRAHFADGAVSLAGRVDASFGGPPTPRPAVLVEVKGGVWRDEHRADAHLYALLASLRDRKAPRASITVCATDGRVNVEPVRPSILENAALRVATAIETAAALAAGEAPDARPGGYCSTCPALRTCEPGQRHQDERASDRER